MKINEKIREDLYVIQDVPVFYQTPFENIQGMLAGVEDEDIPELYKSIKPCTCGGKPECLQTECMGDFDFSIYCDNPDCTRVVTMSMYDFDVTPEEDEIALAIRDWNNGLTQEEIDASQKEHQEKVKIRPEDLIWKNIYANNIIGNPREGIYCILNMDCGDKFYACKWTIEFQKKEIEPQMVSSEADLYILHMKRYLDLDKPLEYPEPSKDGFHDINDYGHFVRAYRTLEEAKIGAAARCGWQGLNKETLIK